MARIAKTCSEPTPMLRLLQAVFGTEDVFSTTLSRRGEEMKNGCVYGVMRLETT